MNKKLLLLGGGGHCKSVIDSLLKTKSYTEVGIIDKKENVGKSILGIPIIGCDDDLFELYQNGYNNAFITIGSIGNPSIRVKLFKVIKEIGFEIPNIIDFNSIISEHVTLEEGIFVGKNAVINAGSFIENCAIINTGSIVEHDCIIGQFSHIAPGTVLCGEVQIGEHTHVGARSVVKQQVKIGANTLIGMGSVVLKNVPENVIAYGNPCKEVTTL
jgi:sugar O-acyltransferase, sialic acid O-acetyltransferase NeuD family